jgi:tetratricopeptide (TPR) repeat protein
LRTLVLKATVIGLLSLTAAAALHGQQAPKSSGATLRLSTRSAEARTAFYAGVDAVENLQPQQAERHLQLALASDSALGIARAYYAAFAPAIPADVRAQQLQRAAADAMNATVGELLMVLALRAPAGNERRTLLKAAVDAVPEDPHVLYQYAVNLSDVAERIRLLESMNRRFPEFAPAFNLLAYAKARDLGDVPGGLVLVQRYLQLAPTNANAHDSFAELLQWSGRLPEAVEHYNEAIRLNAEFASPHSGRAEVALLQGNGRAARAHYQNALRLTPSMQQRNALRQATATSYIVEGDPKLAMAEMKAAAQEAEAQGQRALAAQAYRNMAVIEAALGTKTLVDVHLQKADALSGANNILQRGFAAAAYALAGDLTAAKPLAAGVTATATASNSPLLKRQAAALNEIVQYASGEADSARVGATGSGNYGALGKLLLAENYARRGRRAEARVLAREVLTYHEVDIFTLIARRRAQRLL